MHKPKCRSDSEKHRLACKKIIEPPSIREPLTRNQSLIITIKLNTSTTDYKSLNTIRRFSGPGRRAQVANVARERLYSPLHLSPGPPDRLISSLPCSLKSFGPEERKRGRVGGRGEGAKSPGDQGVKMRNGRRLAAWGKAC